MKKVEAKMKLDRSCKNSVVYKAADIKAEDIIRSMYLMNPAYRALTMPKEITVTITSE